MTAVIAQADNQQWHLPDGDVWRGSIMIYSGGSTWFHPDNGQPPIRVADAPGLTDCSDLCETIPISEAQTSESDMPVIKAPELKWDEVDGITAKINGNNETLAKRRHARKLLGDAADAAAKNQSTIAKLKTWLNSPVW